LHTHVSVFPFSGRLKSVRGPPLEIFTREAKCSGRAELPSTGGRGKAGRYVLRVNPRISPHTSPADNAAVLSGDRVAEELGVCVGLCGHLFRHHVFPVIFSRGRISWLARTFTRSPASVGAASPVFYSFALDFFALFGPGERGVCRAGGNVRNPSAAIPYRNSIFGALDHGVYSETPRSATAGHKFTAPIRFDTPRLVGRALPVSRTVL